MGVEEVAAQTAPQRCPRSLPPPGPQFHHHWQQGLSFRGPRQRFRGKWGSVILVLHRSRFIIILFFIFFLLERIHSKFVRRKKRTVTKKRFTSLEENTMQK